MDEPTAASAIWRHRRREQQLFQQAIIELHGLGQHVALLTGAKPPLPSPGKIDGLTLCLRAINQIEDVIADKDFYLGAQKGKSKPANGQLDDRRKSKLTTSAVASIGDPSLAEMIADTKAVHEDIMRHFDDSAPPSDWPKLRAKRLRQIQRVRNLLFRHFAGA